MSLITHILKELNRFFFPPPKPEVREERFLCLFLKYGSDFYFISDNKDLHNPKSFRPLLIKLTELGQIEDRFSLLNEFMFQEFDISPDRIKLAKEFVSLSPLKEQTYYFAIIEISGEDTKELELKKSFGSFTCLPLPYISLKSDQNFFFYSLVNLIG